MKDKNLLYCFFARRLLITNRLVFDAEKGPKAPEVSTPAEFALDRNEKKYRAEMLGHATWMVKHLQDTDFGSADWNRQAKISGEDISLQIEDIKEAKAADDKAKKKADPKVISERYDRLNQKIAIAQKLVDAYRKTTIETREKEKIQQDYNALEKRFMDKTHVAENHFQGLKGGKNADNHIKILSDYLNDFWNNELNDNQRLLLADKNMFRTGRFDDHNPSYYSIEKSLDMRRKQIRIFHSLEPSLLQGGEGGTITIVLQNPLVITYKNGSYMRE